MSFVAGQGTCPCLTSWTAILWCFRVADTVSYSKLQYLHSEGPVVGRPYKQRLL